MVGLDTGEVKVDSLCESVQEPAYDFVYHGACHLAKGLEYYIELAKLLPNYKFFVPSDQKDAEKIIGRKITVNNIVFKHCSWETGLKDVVVNSRVTINPSLWSAPIEGALIKSIAYGQRVATVKSEFGYEREISEYVDLIRLPLDTREAAKKLLCELKLYKQKVGYDGFDKKISKNIFRL